MVPIEICQHFPKIYQLVIITVLLIICFYDFSVLATGPSFDVPIVNVTVVAGQTAVLPCSINRIGEYKVSTMDTVLNQPDR